MSALVQQQAGALAAVTEAEVLNVLQNSLYPGAALPSIALVLSYCKAAGLDPMQKPVHIVPMWDGKAKQMRDTVMPGIGLYRTQAARTGQYAGVSDPTFGPTITGKVGGVEISYPEWCRVSVKRTLASGQVAEFPATEFWLENYAVKGGAEKSIAPNAMWQKRPFGQIAKCAEAQALRKAFPEIGSQPTAEEMEGKSLDERDVTPARVEPAADPRRAELIATLEAAARTNGATLKAEFAKVSQADRSLLGTAEWDRIKKLVVPTKTDAEPAKPSYAVLLDQINAATEADALAVILGDIAHLPADQQAELMDAAKMRMEGM